MMKKIDINIDEESFARQEKFRTYSKIFSDLGAWASGTTLARHPLRPYTLDYINRFFRFSGVGG